MSQVPVENLAKSNANITFKTDRIRWMILASATKGFQWITFEQKVFMEDGQWNQRVGESIIAGH